MFGDASAMEKMIAKMLGFTPEQMHETLSGLQSLASNLGDTLRRIEDNQSQILLELSGVKERLENDGRNAASKRRATRGSGSAGSADDASGGD